MVALPSRRSGLRGLLVGIAALTTFLGMRTYVPTPSAQIAAAPALAPTPVRAPRPDVPLPIDETRYGEKVRWLADRQLSRPPEWRVLLLDKTFRNVSNTTAKVAACPSSPERGHMRGMSAGLVSVLGLAGYVAKIKAEHAKDHFFSVRHPRPGGTELRDVKVSSVWRVALQVSLRPHSAVSGTSRPGRAYIARGRRTHSLFYKQVAAPAGLHSREDGQMKGRCVSFVVGQ
ncbi:unnamed protein product [Effrenium voratum]|nr:unnamed protein product [Effrenium voratum]